MGELAMELNLDLAIPYFKKYGIRRAAVFGSVARNEDRDDSDIDFLVSFSSKKYSLLEIIGLKQDLEDEFRRPIDVITYDALNNDLFSKAVLAEAKVIYEQN